MEKAKKWSPLDISASLIIITIISVLMFLLVKEISQIGKPSKITPINFVLDNTYLKRYDSNIISVNKNFVKELNFRIDTLKLQINDLQKVKTEIQEAEKRNDEYFRLMLTLVGSVFAIVGFFGFKSIHDTRQAALESAKSNAEKIAIKTANERIEALTDDKVQHYLENRGQSLLITTASQTAERVAFNKASEVASQTSTEESARYFASLNERYNAVRDDVRQNNVDNRILRARIAELESKYYGNEDEGVLNEAPNGEEQNVAEIIPANNPDV